MSADEVIVELTLAPGTYRLYCRLYSHEAEGMEATLIVSGG